MRAALQWFNLKTNRIAEEWVEDWGKKTSVKVKTKDRMLWGS